MSMDTKVKKAMIAFVWLVVMAGVYSGIVAICNRSLRENGLLNPFTKFALTLILTYGLYRIYRWFYDRISKIS